MISGEPARRKIIIVGASSGGHLALMTGLRLPAEKVVAVVSISGIGDMKTDQALSPGRYKILFSHEPSDEEIRDASPATYLKPDSPPILCTHTPKDNVVPIQSAQVFLDAVHKNGTIGESYYYEKEETGYSHRIWIPGSSPHRLYPEIEAAIASFIKKCLMLNAEC
jgi:dipeptidyl aminopeptidase/acylaminoacyl peptidase